MTILPKSRYDNPQQIREMQEFTLELARLGCADKVMSVAYDSKVSLCAFDLIDKIDDHSRDLIFIAAKKSISQFEWDGIVHHGGPLADFDDDPDLIIDDDDEQSAAEAEWLSLAEEFDDSEEPDDQEDDALAMAAAMQPSIASQAEIDTKAEHRRLAGLEGEEALAKWFSDNQLSYVAICQNKELFSNLFTGTVKRPDFLLLFDSLGLIAVDAKNITPYKPKNPRGSTSFEYYTLPLYEEVRKAIAFERIFRIPIWYAIKGKDAWYWISALKAFEIGYRKSGRDFISIKVSDFVRVSHGDDLAKLYGQRMPSYRHIAALNVPAV